jgi:hypothetical protein
MHGPSTPERSGFHGTIGSLPLTDLLQVWSLNRFSGVVTVTFRDQSGHLYFVEGEIVHAEAPGLVGEQALIAVLGWPEGGFELFPNTTTLHRTIEKRLSHLMLDAHRELDERRHGGSVPSATRAPPATSAPPATFAPPAPAAPQAPSRAPLLDQIRAMRGVTQVVRFGRDGRPAGDGAPGAEALAAKGLHVAITHAAFVAEAFGLHDLSVVTLRSDREPFVVVHSRGNYLCVAVEPGEPIDGIVAQLRAVLVRQPRR